MTTTNPINSQIEELKEKIKEIEMNIKKIEELKKDLKRDISLEEKDSDLMPDEISWNYQHGILISVNQARLVLELINKYKEVTSNDN